MHEKKSKIANLKKEFSYLDAMCFPIPSPHPTTKATPAPWPVVIYRSPMPRNTPFNLNMTIFKNIDIYNKNNSSTSNTRNQIAARCAACNKRSAFNQYWDDGTHD